MGKIKDFIRKFIALVIAILLTVIPLLSNPGNPVYATSVTNPYPSIAGGLSHTIALKSDGTVWSWGDNSYGQLGDGTTITRYIPVQVQGLNGQTITGVAAGNNSSYFLASDGTVWSVGYNVNGQLGDGTTTTRTLPVQVKGLSGKTITAVAAGINSAYFLASDGTVWSVGLNTYGQLGDGTTTNRTLPVQVQGLSSAITAVTVGNNSAYFLASDGTVWSVGYNYSGQLGDGTATTRTQPVKVQGLSSKTIKAIAGYGYSAYFLATDGTVWSVGLNNSGQLGDGTTTNKSVSVQVQGLSSKTITDVAGGNSSAYFLVSDGTVWSVGLNSYGQLGDGTTTNRSQPVQVQGLSNMTINNVAAGNSSAYFLASDGTVWSVGYNNNGQLGDGSVNNQKTPVQSLIALIPPVVTITSPSPGITNNNTPLLNYIVGIGTTVEVKVDGAVVNNVSGNNLDPLSDGSHTVVVQATDAGGKTWSSSVTFTVQTSNNPHPSIAGGLSHTIALKSDGTVWSWGDNSYGQLGDGTTITRYIPVQVQGLNGQTITGVAAGNNSSYFLASDGTVWSVGYNVNGQLGDGTTTTRTLPVLTSLPERLPYLAKSAILTAIPRRLM